MNHVTLPLNITSIGIFPSEISKFCYIKQHTYKLHVDTNFCVLVWPTFGNSSISKGFDQKNYFFEERTWFKFNNLELLVGVILKVNTNVAKG